MAFPIPGFQLPAIPGLSVPKISAARIVAPAAGWNQATYADAVSGASMVYTKAPALLVAAEPRQGWYTPTQFQAPVVKIEVPVVQLPPPAAISLPSIVLPVAPAIPPYAVPTVSIPAVSIPSISIPAGGITLPTISIPRVGTTQQYWIDTVGGIYPFNTDWGFWFLNMNFIRDGIKSMVGSVLYAMWYYFVQPQIDRVQSAVQGSGGSAWSGQYSLTNPATNHTVSYTLYGRSGPAGINGGILSAQDAINTQLSKASAILNHTMSTFLGDLNVKLGQFRDDANNALAATVGSLNQGIEKLRGNVNGALAAGQSNLQNGLNKLKGSIQDGVNGALSAFSSNIQDELNTVIGGAGDQINAGFVQVAGFSTQAINSIVPQLWAVLGLPANTLIVPILFQARADGFSYYAPVAGVVVHYAAFGT